MALTVEDLAIRITADTTQYQRNMKQAEASAFKFDKSSSTALGNLGHAFTNVSKGALTMGNNVNRALREMGRNPGPSELDRQLDKIIAKQREVDQAFARTSRIMSPTGGASGGAALPGGTSILPDTPVIPNPFARVTAGADEAGRSVRALRHDTGNIAAQFQDIGVTAAMGMNPLIIALQQGTQLSAIFAGQGTRQALGSLKEAFLSVVSPVSLLTIGLVAGGAALVQFIQKSASASKEASTLNKQLDETTKAIDALREASKDTAMSTDDLIEKFGQAASSVALLYDQMERLNRLEAINKVNQLVEKLGETYSGLGAKVAIVDELYESQRGNADLIRMNAEQMATAIADIGNAYGMTLPQAREFLALEKELQTAKTLDDRQRALDKISAYLTELSEKQTTYNQKQVDAAQLATQVAIQVANITGALTAATGQAYGLAGGLQAAAEAAGRALSAQLKLNAGWSAPGVALNPFAPNAGEELTERAGGASVADQNRLDEERTYIEEERQNILERKRLADLRKQYGLDDLEDSLFPKAGGSKKKGGGGAKRGPEDRYDDAIRKEIEGMYAEAAALNQLTLGYDEYGFAVERAKKEAQLLQDLENKGVTITPALAAEVSNLALQWEVASTAAEKARERHEEFENQMEEFRSLGEDTFKGLISGAESFSDALDNVIAKLADMLLTNAFDSFWSMGMGALGFGGSGADPLAAALRGIPGLGNVRSFEGGGYTWNGPRVGGIDGRGGQLHVLHPNETVHDNQKGGMQGIQATFSPQLAMTAGVTQEQLLMAMGVMRDEYNQNFLPMLKKEFPNYQMRVG